MKPSWMRDLEAALTRTLEEGSRIKELIENPEEAKREFGDQEGLDDLFRRLVITDEHLRSLLSMLERIRPMVPP